MGLEARVWRHSRSLALGALTRLAHVGFTRVRTCMGNGDSTEHVNLGAISVIVTPPITFVPRLVVRLSKAMALIPLIDVGPPSTRYPTNLGTIFAATY
jgi:hypothetical protein